MSQKNGELGQNRNEEGKRRKGREKEMQQKAMVDADFLIRKNTRTILASLAELTNTRLMIGNIAGIEARNLLKTWEAEREVAWSPLRDYEKWEEGLGQAGLLGHVSEAEILEHTAANPGIHRWVREMWEELDGDMKDRTHVHAGIAIGAECVLTGNMHCIPAEELKEESKKAGFKIPEVLKRDKALDFFREKLEGNPDRAGCLEAAVLPAVRDHVNLESMWEQLLPKLAPSFPDGAAEMGAIVRRHDHEYFRKLAWELESVPTTREIVKATFPITRAGELKRTDKERILLAPIPRSLSIGDREERGSNTVAGRHAAQLGQEKSQRGKEPRREKGSEPEGGER